MLNQIDSQRLEKNKRDIALLNIRFPIATIAKRTGCDKGNVSKALKGNVPCSDNFVNRFYASFRDDLNKARPNKEVIEAPRTYPLGADRSEKLKAIAGTLSELAAIFNNLA
jgi:hypothetical protein